jgi:hypothetical protein
MRTRCSNENSLSYAHYGGRGISVCERWDLFENFYEDMGESPEGMSLDRRENDGDYSPENCRWATPEEQARNKRDNRTLTFRGETKCVVEWAEETGIPGYTIWARLNAGWPARRILTEKVRTLRRRVG